MERRPKIRLGDPGKRRRLLWGAALLGLAAAVPGRGGAETLDLPDLIPLQPDGIHIGAPDDFAPNVRALRFGTFTENVGAHPLELLGIPRVGADLSADARQCVRWTVRVCEAYRDAAPLAWHDEHGHWHFPGFALHELRTLTRDGVPNMNGAPVASGPKLSSCIRDDQFDRDRPAGDPLNRVPSYYQACTNLRQGITPGWMDYYPAELDGQQILLTGVKDGTYALVIRTDPDNRLLESDETNNMTFLRIAISDFGTKVTVLPG